MIFSEVFILAQHRPKMTILSPVLLLFQVYVETASGSNEILSPETRK